MGEMKDTAKDQVKEKGWGAARREEPGLQLTLNRFQHLPADDTGVLCRRMYMGPRKHNCIRVALVQRLLKDMCTSHNIIRVVQWWRTL